MKIGHEFSLFIKKVLTKYELPNSPSVLRLLMMIAAHESCGFLYVQQMSCKKAKGLFQMEKIALDEVKRYVKLRPSKFKQCPNLDVVKHNDLVFNTEIAIIFARIFLLAKPEPLPPVHNLDALAVYAKKYWNTFKGKATPALYKKAFNRFY